MSSDLSLFLLGEAHVANLRECTSISPDSVEEYQEQLRSVVTEYARLVDAPSVLRGILEKLEPRRIDAGEVRQLVSRLSTARRNAMFRAATRGEWTKYYAHRFLLAWASSYYRVGKLYCNARWGWFERPGLEKEAVLRACRPQGKVISICA